MAGDPYDLSWQRGLQNSACLPPREEDYQNRLSRQALQADQQKKFYEMMQQAQMAERARPKTATEAYLNAEGGILLETADGGKVVIPAGLLKALGTLVAMAEMAKLVPADAEP